MLISKDTSISFRRSQHVVQSDVLSGLIKTCSKILLHTISVNQAQLHSTFTNYGKMWNEAHKVENLAKKKKSIETINVTPLNFQMCLFFMLLILSHFSWLNPKEINFFETTQSNSKSHSDFLGEVI